MLIPSDWKPNDACPILPSSDPTSVPGRGLADTAHESLAGTVCRIFVSMPTGAFATSPSSVREWCRDRRSTVRDERRGEVLGNHGNDTRRVRPPALGAVLVVLAVNAADDVVAD